MPATRRVVHKIDPAHVVTIDDQLWPINVSLLVLAGFAAGVIIAAGTFDDPRPLYNGWARLGTLALSTGLLMWGATRLDNRTLRRRFQLAALLSVIFHVALVVMLGQVYLAYAAPAEAEAQTTDAEEVAVIFNEHFQIPDPAAREEFERPVDVETPREEAVDVARDEAQAEQPLEESQPTPVPGTTPQVEPSSIEMRERQEAVPHRGDALSKRSRHTADIQAPPSETISVPQLDALTQQAAEVQAQISPVRRQATAASAQKQPAEREPAPAIRQQAAQIARTQSAEPSPTQSSSLPTVNRQISQPANVPRMDIETPRPLSASPAAQPTEVQPAAALAERRQADPPVVVRQAPEPKAATAAEPTRIDVVRQQPVDSPTIASTSKPAPARSPREAQISAPVSVEQPSGDLDQSPASPSPTAAAQVARGESAMPMSAAIEAASPAPTPEPANVAIATAQRAEQSPTPTVNSRAAVSPQPGRAARTAPVEASPTPVESPALSQASGAAQLDAQPSRLAMAKGATGVFGAGEEQNFDRGLPASHQPAPAPSAASRAAATQQSAPGPALSPSSPATIAKSTAGAKIPTATVLAQDVPNPSVAGAARPGIEQASASAAVTKADAAASRGAVTAAQGSADIDTGPTQIVANLGASRAAGGGAPQVNLTAPTQRIAKAPAGGAPLATIAAQAVATTAEAPVGNGGGEPAVSPAVNSSSTAANKAASGGLPNAAAAAEAPAAAAPGPVVAAALGQAQPGAGAVAGPVVNGGSPSLSRVAGQAFAADAKADAPQMPAGPSSGVAPTGGAAEAAGSEAARVAAALPGRVAATPVGAVAGDVPVDAPALSAPGAGLNPHRVEQAHEPATATGTIAAAGALRKTTVAGVPDGLAMAAEEPGGQPISEQSGQPQEPAASAVGAPARATGGLPVEVAALPGSGGLGSEVSPQAGSLSRRAQRDTELIHAGTARFLNRKSGGPLAIDGRARDAAQAFALREGKKSARSGGPGRPTARTERAIELGLDFLARHQAADGSWSLNFGAGRRGYEKEKASLQTDTAATGLALLAFLGAGYDHFDDQYQGVVKAALEHLVKHQKPDGDLYVELDPNSTTSNYGVWLYSHGIASIALCEAFGMTGDEALREPAQKAIDFIAASQDPKNGGWRYQPKFSSDTSVTGWQLMALKSGELAGLKVPADTYRRASHWLDVAGPANSGGARYAYDPFAPDRREATGKSSAHERLASPAMTSVGLLMQLYFGSNRDDPRMVDGADYLLANLPSNAAGQRDTYYWYYATQVMFHMKGNYWKTWNDRLHPLLAERQIQSGTMAGSWDPGGAAPDRWGPQGGRLYVTTMNLLSLEVYYRHLPLYESTAK